MAFFITFEGGEGSGKTFQAKALYRRLCRLAIPAVITQEPGGTELGQKLTRWLKWAQATDMSPQAELFIFNASRTQLIDEVIRPGLEEGKVVICDRYSDSTTVYQGYGRGLDLEMVKAVNNIAISGLKPDLSILLDVPVEVGFDRKAGRKRDRFENEDLAFHQRIRDGYLKLAAEERERWLVVDADQPKARIRRIIWERINLLISRQVK